MTKQEYIMKVMTKLTDKYPTGVKLETVFGTIQREAKREVDLTSVALTIFELQKEGKIINIPRNVAPHPDAEKQETAFLSIAFNLR